MLWICGCLYKGTNHAPKNLIPCIHFWMLCQNFRRQATGFIKGFDFVKVAQEGDRAVLMLKEELRVVPTDAANAE